ncbi:IS30 family transposase [Bifidobacterium tibiigranuli]|uniref:IS30 family transposase n=1 Tax=Bifidobacterium tibiigranuli TaxID=2172043 RepID=UPI003AF8698B
MKVYTHLDSGERILLEKLRFERHETIRQVARDLRRSASTVSRELRRGLWFASNENESYRPYRPKRLKTGAWTAGPFYSALTAQRKAETRACAPRKPRRMAGARLHAWVADALGRGWTPELIEGRLKLEYPDDPEMRISHECLYQWIYAGGHDTDWRRYLPRAKRHRARRKGRKAQRIAMPMRVPLALRPRAVDGRREFGHYESDTVIGSAPTKRCIDTQVERKTRRLFARLIADKSAPETAKAEYAVYSAIPAGARIDRTWDNGTESALHRLVDEALGMLTYYADPYSPWQRGSNENRNGHIRRYLPKRTSLRHLTQGELDDIVQEINDTPMKLLGYHTPNEAWQEELGKLRLQSQPANHKHS